MPYPLTRPGAKVTSNDVAPLGKRDRTNSLQELQVIQNSTETKKMESFPNCLLPSPQSESLPAYRDHKERLVLMSARGRVTAVEPQGCHWYLGAWAGHLGVGEGSHSPGVLCPVPEAVSALGEFPLGYSCCFLGKMWYVWAEKSSRNELPRANSFCKLLLRRWQTVGVFCNCSGWGANSWWFHPRA